MGGKESERRSRRREGSSRRTRVGETGEIEGGPLSPFPPSSWAGVPAPSPLLNDKRPVCYFLVPQIYEAPFIRSALRCTRGSICSPVRRVFRTCP